VITHISSRNTKALIDASKMAVLEVNKATTKVTVISYHQNEGQNNYIIDPLEMCRSSDIYIMTTVTYNNLIYEEMKSRLNLGIPCYY
jgi:hypothetical protein